MKRHWQKHTEALSKAYGYSPGKTYQFAESPIMASLRKTTSHKREESQQIQVEVLNSKGRVVDQGTLIESTPTRYLVSRGGLTNSYPCHLFTIQSLTPQQ